MSEPNRSARLIAAEQVDIGDPVRLSQCKEFVGRTARPRVVFRGVVVSVGRHGGNGLATYRVRFTTPFAEGMFGRTAFYQSDLVREES